MKFKIGDRINVVDGSYGFAIYNSEFKKIIPKNMRSNVVVVATGLSVNKHTDRFDVNCDLMVADERGNYVFIRSNLCEAVDKQIELRYFCDGNDVTDNISNETKKNLANLRE